LFRADRRNDRQTDGQAERRTGMTKLIFAFRRFEEVPKKAKHMEILCSFGLMTITKTNIRARMLNLVWRSVIKIDMYCICSIICESKLPSIKDVTFELKSYSFNMMYIT
jgi:hypothetical protein